jgi:exodeoxyribonuclease VII small subunit
LNGINKEATLTMPEPQTAESQPSFEQALASLETIVHDLEAGRLSLAESLGRYEEGIKLLKQCYSQLEQAERKIELLTGIDAAGNPITAPFDDQATIDQTQEDQPPRSRRGRKAAKTGNFEPPPEPVSSANPVPPAMDEPGSLF